MQIYISDISRVGIRYKITGMIDVRMFEIETQSLETEVVRRAIEQSTAYMLEQRREELNTELNEVKATEKTYIVCKDGKFIWEFNKSKERPNVYWIDDYSRAYRFKHKSVAQWYANMFDGIVI